MGTLLRRHSTLLAFSVSLAASTAFVACGSDDSTTTTPGADAGDSGTGATGNGGATGTGGKSAGGTPGTGGKTNTGGAATGGAVGTGGTTGTGGTAPVDSGPDAVTSNGDAQSDTAANDNTN